MEERVINHGERLATIEEAVKTIASALTAWAKVPEELHGIRASIEGINTRLDDGARSFERHEQDSRIFDRRVLEIELKQESTEKVLNGDGPNLSGLVSDVRVLKEYYIKQTGQIDVAGFVAKAAWPAIVGLLGALAGWYFPRFGAH